jgi:hypothetical protein
VTAATRIDEAVARTTTTSVASRAGWGVMASCSNVAPTPRAGGAVAPAWRQCGLIVSLVLALAFVASTAGAEAPGLRDAVAQARTMRLAEDPEWFHLLHYQTGVLGGTSSEVSRGDFFLSPRGSVDRDAELLATLTAFFAPLQPGHEDGHALCRFPARRDWLNRRLHFLESNQPPRCPDLDAAMARLAPTGVHLVYASTYLGNPASAFGHAFLHLTTRAGDAAREGSEERDVLDRGIEYRALTDTKNPLFYAVEGVVGMFPGRVEVHPYNEQARRYTAEQGRDLWEYDLALSAEETTFLMLHMWELRTARIDYYYLTRNCAFEILALLETAAPRLDLVRQLKALVVPIDIVRAVFDVPGLVRGVAYRPSLETRLHTRLAALTDTEQRQVRRLLADPLAPWPAAMPDERRALVLDAAIFELEAHASKDLESASMTEAKRKWRMLVGRRHTVVPEPPVGLDWSKRPDHGHGPMRVLFGSGVTSQYGDAFGTIGYRLALHDLTDPVDGGEELAQVVILDARLRYAWASRSLTLDTLTFADLVALNPVAPAEPRLSFRIRAFGERLHDRDCPDCFAHGADGAVGATVATRDRKVALFMMADAYVAFLPHATGLDSSVVRLGLGPYGGVRVHLGNTVALLSGTASYLPGEKLTSTYDARLTVKYTLGREVALGVELVAQPLSVEGQLSSYVYF